MIDSLQSDSVEIEGYPSKKLCNLNCQLVIYRT